MQASKKELAFLSEEQDKISKQDWSDQMPDPPDTRRQYEVRITTDTRPGGQYWNEGAR